MRSNDLHPERWLIGFHHSHSMHQPDRFDWPSLFHLLENQFKLALSHPLKGFILDAGNRFAPFSPSHHPKEINYRTHPLRNLALAQQRRLVDGLGRNGHSSCHSATDFAFRVPRSAFTSASLHWRKQRNLIAFLKHITVR